jgi:hypothetical protein
MNNTPILICYDGSEDAARGIETAAALLGTRHAVVINIAPILTPSETPGRESSTSPTKSGLP